MNPKDLDMYAFWWTEVRLVVAAIALLIGGTPPVYWLLSAIGLGSLPLLQVGLTLAWIVSGITAVYLLYRWYQNKMMLFGGKAPLDTASFLVACVSGINLGLVGLIGQNIGMSITSNYFVFVVVALLYLASSYHLYMRQSQTGGKLF